MPGYKNILVAIDLSEDSNQIIEKAVQLSALTNADIHVIHVIEPISYAYGGDIPMDLSEVQSELDKHASKTLDEICKKAGLNKENYIVSSGRTASEVHRVAEEIAADLIIVGSHGRHGIQLLLGSTANAVLHGAKCDVLAVKISR